MRKPFCDKCKKECVSRVIRIGGNVEHFTNQGETVGEDNIPWKDLCKDCGQVIVDFLGVVPVPQDFDRDVSMPARALQ